MPRVSRAQTEKNRAAIEGAASRLIRERGLGVSVADLMGAAGLTHGGFYGHFQSKDELTATACNIAFAESQERWRQRIAEADGQAASRAALIEGYLSTRNRADPGHSCPLTALAADVAREEVGKPVREAFHVGAQQLIDILAAVQPADLDAKQQRADALTQLSTLVGALLLARATEGTPLSDEFLHAPRAQLLAR